MNEKFLGYVSARLSSSDPTKSDNALIKVIGKIDSETKYFKKLLLEKAKECCPPNGEVFGPQFFLQSNIDFNTGNFIEFSIKEGEEKPVKNVNQSDFVIDYNHRPKTINLPRLVPCTGKIATIISNGYVSPDEINIIIDTKNVFKNKDTSFFLYERLDNRIIGLFKFSSTSNHIESNYGKEVQEFKIFEELIVTDKENCHYALIRNNDNNLERGRIIDFMSNAQLSDWFKVKVKNISKIEKTILDRICEFPETTSFEDDLECIRLNRLKAKTETIDIDSQIIIKLVCTHSKYFSEFNDNFRTIENEVRSNIKNKYIDEAPEIIKQNKKTLETQQKKLDLIKDKLFESKNKMEKNAALFKKNLEEKHKKYLNQIKEKEEQIKSLEDNYNSIIATLKAAVPILSIRQPDSNEDYNNGLYKFEFPKVGITYRELQDKGDISFKTFITRNVCYENEKVHDFLTQIKRVFSYKACFVPNTSWAFIFAKAIRNSTVFTIHVEYNWLHFRDFCKHGLSDVFEIAYKNKNVNYILLLDGINVTQPECGLRPILNLINNNEPLLECNSQPFPKNLTIMATVLPTDGENPIGLKLQKKYYTKWYAIGNPDNDEDHIDLPDKLTNYDIDEPAYLEPSDLPKKNITEPATGIEVYFEY